MIVATARSITITMPIRITIAITIGILSSLIVVIIVVIVAMSFRKFQLECKSRLMPSTSRGVRSIG